MMAFSGYFERTWILGSFLPPLWSHYDNIGPRTTNLAEGWHNQLNHSLCMSHPSPKNFLHWLQRCQFEVQCCEIQLAAGRPHKQCDPVYVALDEKIANAKLQFNLRVGHIFMQVLSDPWYMERVRVEITSYSRYACYLIAGED